MLMAFNSDVSGVISEDERGQVLKIVLITQYPNGEIKSIPMGLEPVKLVVFDHDEIRNRLKEIGVSDDQWCTGSWEENPSILIERKDGLVILYCKYTGHWHLPNSCYAAGPVVYPFDHQQILDGAEEIHL